MKARMLVLGDYPITNARHGGQKRTKALVEYYSSFISSVKYVGVYFPGTYEKESPDDVLVGQEDVIHAIESDYQAIELITGESPDIDIHVRSYIAKVLMEYIPDIIHIEQPYLYAGIRVLLNELNIHPFVIYGSQNIEYEMKRSILRATDYDRDKTRSIIKKTRQLEELFSKEADLVVAVSSYDADVHRQMGARHVVVGKNGIDEIASVSKKSISYWKAYKKQHGIDHILSFVGSGHPPNHKGFLKFVGDDSRFLPANSMIVIAGSVSDYFNYAYKKDSSNYFWTGIDTVGVLSEDDLGGLLHQSDTIILPIGLGGGSNLKSAEAIYSKKKIVASNFAFRSFEEYTNLPNVTIANNKEEFHQAILSAIDSPAVELSGWEKKKSDRVVWKYSLLPIKRRLVWRLGRYRVRHMFTSLVRPVLRRVKHSLKRFASS